MKIKRMILLIAAVMLTAWGVPGDGLAGAAGTALADVPPQKEETPVSLHGALRVEGGKLVGQKGEAVRLMGMSTHGINWFPEYVNEEGFRTLRDDWKVNCVRLAMYTQEYNGYCSGGNKDELKALVKKGVEYAGNLGMYVIIDWHILSDQDPNVHKAEEIGRAHV